MSLAPCTACGRFARPSETCPFCGGVVGTPVVRSRVRASRSGILAATAALSLACGGTVTGDDAAVDAARDRASDVSEVDDVVILQPDDAADAGIDVLEEQPLPPPPYGSPPIPHRRVV